MIPLLPRDTLRLLFVLLFCLIEMALGNFAHSATVTDAVRRAAAAEMRIWVFLADKGPDAETRASKSDVHDRARARMARTGSAVDPLLDLPVYFEYTRALAAGGMVLKNQSRWLNAVTGWIHPDDLDDIAAFPFVDSLQVVVTFRRPVPGDGLLLPALPKVTVPAADVFEYGVAGGRHIRLLGINYLHQAGLTGRGVRIGFMDTGFSLGIRAFDCMNLQGTRDFINGDEDVGDKDTRQMRHGTGTLSLCAAFDEGELVGVAPAAEYVVAKTELVDAEIQAEEDNWVAGLEWLDSMGCDIVSSSLGYADWYSDEDFDGNTAPSTVAADLAAARGILVVNAAGNFGDPGGCTDDNELIVPADGDSVLAVGACDFEGVRAWFSSCGPTADGRIKPDVLAPGVGVWIAVPNTGFYQPGDGTSYATPIVSGVCALLLEKDPTLTPWQLIQLLRSTADKSNKPSVSYGWGVVQAVEAAGLDTTAIDPERQYECERTAGSVVVWPNPAELRAVIDIEGGTEGDGRFRVFTVTGRLVFEGDISEGRGEWLGQTEHGGHAAPGVYLIQVRTDLVNEIVKLAWLPRD